MRKRMAVLLVLISVLMLFPVQAVTSQSNNGVLYYMYGMHTCPHCHAMNKFLQEYYPDQYYFCDIASSPTCAKYFEKYLSETGLPGYVPQIIVVKNMSYVLAIVIGEYENKTFFDSLAKLQPSIEIPLYEGNTLIGYLKLRNMTVHRKLVSLLYLPTANNATNNTVQVSTSTHTNSTAISTTQAQSSNTSKKNLNPLTYLVPLALSDSVNPCTIAIYTVLLATVSIISRKRALLVGILFIVGVFAGYTMLGLSISYGLSFINIPQQVLSAILIGFGFLLVFSSIRKEECKTCKEGGCKEPARYRLIHYLLNRAESMPVFSLLLGLILSLTLLPCSMGPYVVYLISLREAGVPVLPYILLYNVVFGVPLYAILVSLVIGKRFINMDKYRKWIYLAAGVILVLLGLLYLIV